MLIGLNFPDLIYVVNVIVHAGQRGNESGGPLARLPLRLGDHATILAKLDASRAQCVRWMRAMEKPRTGNEGRGFSGSGWGEPVTEGSAVTTAYVWSRSCRVIPWGEAPRRQPSRRW